MDRDTQIGGPEDRFPHTRGSVIEAVKGSDAAAREGALASIVAAYWKPVYKYIRLKWNAANEEAKDFTQAFFASAMERDVFARSPRELGSSSPPAARRPDSGRDDGDEAPSSVASSGWRYTCATHKGWRYT